jgi:hypothetical protein
VKVEIAISKHQFWPILQLINSRSPFLSDWERKRQYSEPRRQRALVDVVFSQQLTRLPGNEGDTDSETGARQDHARTLVQRCRKALERPTWASGNEAFRCVACVSPNGAVIAFDRLCLFLPSHSFT